MVDKKTRLPILLPLNIKFYDGVPVAYLGMTLKDTPTIVNPAGIQTVDFLDEVTTANSYAELLRWFGIKAMVLLIHQGGSQQRYRQGYQNGEEAPQLSSPEPEEAEIRAPGMGDQPEAREIPITTTPPEE